MSTIHVIWAAAIVVVVVVYIAAIVWFAYIHARWGGQDE
jgi:hypothetical protein